MENTEFAAVEGYHCSCQRAFDVSNIGWKYQKLVEVDYFIFDAGCAYCDRRVLEYEKYIKTTLYDKSIWYGVLIPFVWNQHIWQKEYRV